MEKDYDKAARLNDFASDFQMHKSEIGAGLRQNYNDLNTIQQGLPPTPTETAPAAGEGSRTIRKNADNFFSISRTTPTSGGDGNIKLPFQDLAYHAGGKSKLGSRDTLLLS